MHSAANERLALGYLVVLKFKVKVGTPVDLLLRATEGDYDLQTSDVGQSHKIFATVQLEYSTCMIQLQRFNTRCAWRMMPDVMCARRQSCKLMRL